jgi:hypothetical protein
MVAWEAITHRKTIAKAKVMVIDKTHGLPRRAASGKLRSGEL